MSVFLNKTGTLVSSDTATTFYGMAQRSSVGGTAVRYNLQPDTSSDVVAEAALRNVSTGKLYLPVSVTVNPESNTFQEDNGTEWEIRGLPVKAANATTQWVTVERQLKQ